MRTRDISDVPLSPDRHDLEGMSVNSAHTRDLSRREFPEKSERFVLYQEKAGWQWGWFAQYQRLIEALAAQTQCAPLIVQGDSHATAAGKMGRSGELVRARPVDIVMSGALGTGDMAFPSAFRSVESKPSQSVF